MKYLTVSILCLFYIALIASVQSSKIPHKDKASISKNVKQYRKKNPSDAFCRKFVSQCYSTALQGKTGHVKVTYACQRNGGKHSPSYAFGCKSNNQDVTQVVLNKVGAGYTVTVTQGSTVVVTGTVTDYTTKSISTTSEIDSTITETSTSTDFTTTVPTGTITEVEQTTLTTAIPVTLTSTSTATITTTIPVTSVVTTSTLYTSVLLGTEPVPIMQVQVPPITGSRKRSNKVDNSQFCSAFNSGCSQECGRVRSKPKHVLCHSTGQYQYSLTCYCKNGKVETQHALKNAADQQHITTVSTVSTSTSYATATSTVTIPTTILSTSFATVTSVVPTIQTIVSSTSVTITSTATATTGQSTTVSTSVPVVTSVNTATTTVSSTATSTTQLVLATIGALQAFDSTSNSQGYIQTVLDDPPSYWVTSDRTKAAMFVAVMDPGSGLYQLQSTDNPSNVFISESGGRGADFSKGAYGWAYPGPAGRCGAAGNSATPPSGAGTYRNNPCETFVFSPSADATTLSSGQTVNMLSEWVNPGQTTAKQYAWMLNRTFNKLYQVSSGQGFRQNYPGEETTEVSLRFPA